MNIKIFGIVVEHPKYSRFFQTDKTCQVGLFMPGSTLLWK